jgi:hypothetical protein
MLSQIENADGTRTFFDPSPQIQLVRSYVIDLKEKGRSEFPALSKTTHIDFIEKKE